MLDSIKGRIEINHSHKNFNFFKPFNFFLIIHFFTILTFWTYGWNQKFKFLNFWTQPWKKKYYCRRGISIQKGTMVRRRHTEATKTMWWITNVMMWMWIEAHPIWSDFQATCAFGCSTTSHIWFTVTAWLLSFCLFWHR